MNSSFENTIYIDHQCCQLGSFRMREILFFNIFNA